MAVELMDRPMLPAPGDAAEFIPIFFRRLRSPASSAKTSMSSEGARRLYGYGPDELMGKANSRILHTPEDIAAGRPQEIMGNRSQAGKWEGTFQRVRERVRNDFPLVW
jgi:hypothetical protein